MNEHEHKWHGSPFSTVFACYGCDEILTLEQVATRLNATERLSAEAERIRVTWYRVPLGGGDDTIHDLYHEMMGFVEAYTNALEGKDG